MHNWQTHWHIFSNTQRHSHSKVRFIIKTNIKSFNLRYTISSVFLSPKKKQQQKKSLFFTVFKTMLMQWKFDFDFMIKTIDTMTKVPPSCSGSSQWLKRRAYTDSTVLYLWKLLAVLVQLFSLVFKVRFSLPNLPRAAAQLWGICTFLTCCVFGFCGFVSNHFNTTAKPPEFPFHPLASINSHRLCEITLFSFVVPDFCIVRLPELIEDMHTPQEMCRGNNHCKLLS